MSAKHLIPFDNSESTASFWAGIIHQHSAPGDIVLVPFADDVAIAGAALEQNRRVALLVRTPSQRLRLQGRLAPTSEGGRRRALAQLAGTTKRGTPLDRYINDLYSTTCPHCGDPTPATAFIWDEARGAPVAKELTCEACGFHGSAPADDTDVERANQIERRGLSFWFLLEWLADTQDTSGREIARRHLETSYSPRNLTALADITRKVDAELSDDPTSQHFLRLALLHGLDAGRRQPTSTNNEGIVERNIWHLLTHAPTAEDIDAPIRLAADLESFLREEDVPANVVLSAGPIHQLARQLPSERFALILGAPPALNARAWIWEQLWSRWVFGRRAAGALQPPIGGWPRHVRALGVTMGALVPALCPDGRILFRFQDNADRADAVLAAMAPHASLDELAYQPPLVEPANMFAAAGGAYYVTFTPEPPAPPPDIEPPALATAIETAAVDAATDLLRARAEPLPYASILTAATTRLARSELLHQTMTCLDADISPLAFAKQHMRQGLRGALAQGDLVAVAGHTPTHWWLPEAPPADPLTERVEQVVVDLLDDQESVTTSEIYRHMKGWLVPEAELVEALLTAYGEETEPGVWARCPIDEGERESVEWALRRLGERLAFAVGAGIADVVWGEGGRATHVFNIVETGRWSEVPVDVLPESVAGYLILPDRLVNLVRVKLLRNPLWRQTLAEGGWQLVKVRHLMALTNAEAVDRQDFKKILGLDPIIEQAEAQIPLFWD
ncbi:MAG: hypothetical protein MAG451_00211 [Anaerolineales bacterium]|nr:hypothetical protein [Anaerolineales bacterium]